ncbi:MAG: alpha/beta fold hydrolase [Candidatus Methanoperedens sp.]|nr:alpha/beta fold hydrolase [Candidatus Methanoperedens sp.]
MEKITFRTKDGVTITGNYFKPQKEHSPAFLLLHMMPSTKESWNAFASHLQKQGFAVLAIDLRGHGESTDKNGKKIDYKEFKDAEHRGSMNDIASAKDFLAKQKDIDISRIAIAGASIGANLALRQASVDNDVSLLLLLSAGIDYRGIQALRLAAMCSCPVYILASEGDTYAAESSRKLYDTFPCDKRLNVIKGKSHGTDMFLSEPELIDELLVWVVKRLK